MSASKYKGKANCFPLLRHLLLILLSGTLLLSACSPFGASGEKDSNTSVSTPTKPETLAKSTTVAQLEPPPTASASIPQPTVTRPPDVETGIATAIAANTSTPEIRDLESAWG